MDKNNLAFNTYKSSTQKGMQKLKISKELKSILTKYIKIVDDKSDYLLYNSKFKKMETPNLTLRLNKIFGNRNISVNVLRHIYTSGKHSEN